MSTERNASVAFHLPYFSDFRFVNNFKKSIKTRAFQKVQSTLYVAHIIRLLSNFETDLQQIKSVARKCRDIATQSFTIDHFRLLYFYLQLFLRPLNSSILSQHYAKWKLNLNRHSLEVCLEKLPGGSNIILLYIKKIIM